MIYNLLLNLNFCFLPYIKLKIIMLIDSLKTENLNDVLIILKQDMFVDTEEDWISHFIEDHNCFSLGLYEDNKLISIL